MDQEKRKAYYEANKEEKKAYNKVYYEAKKKKRIEEQINGFMK